MFQHLAPTRRLLCSVFICAAYVMGCDGEKGTSAEETADGLTGQVTFVQGAAQNAGYGPTTKTLHVPLTGRTTAGNIMLVSVAWGGSGAASVTDSQGNRYAPATGVTSWASTFHTQLFYAKNIEGGADTVTASMSAMPATFFEVRAYEYTGVDPIDPVDVAAGASGTSNAPSVTLTLSASNELIFAVGQADNHVSISAGAGFSAHTLALGGGATGEDKTAASAGATKVSLGLEASANWVVQAVGLRPASVATLRQTAGGNAGYPPGSNSLSIKLAADVAAGDLVLVSVGWGGVGVSATSVTDTLGNTYVSAVGPQNWAWAFREQVFYAKNVKAGADSITITLAATPATFFEARVYEYSGADRESPVDVTASAVGTSAAPSVGLTTRASNETLFVVGQADNGVEVHAGAGMRGHGVASSGGALGEDRALSQAGTLNVALSLSASADWVVQAIGIKSSGSSTTSSPPPAPPPDAGTTASPPPPKTGAGGAAAAKAMQGVYPGYGDATGINYLTNVWESASWLNRKMKFIDANLSGTESDSDSNAWGFWDPASPGALWTRQDITPALTVSLVMNRGNYASTRAALQGTANGDHDDVYQHLCDEIRKTMTSPNYHVIARIGHEADCCYDWKFQGGNADVYIQAFRHVANYLRGSACNLPGVFLTNYNGTSEWVKPYKDAAGNATGQSMMVAGYPGDDWVDQIGVDTYAWSPFTSYILPQLQTAEAFAVSHGKSMSIPEWGLNPVQGDDPSWIQGMFDFLSSLPASGPGRLAFHCYFQDFDESNLNSHPNAKAKYLELFGDP